MTQTPPLSSAVEEASVLLSDFTSLNHKAYQAVEVLLTALQAKEEEEAEEIKALASVVEKTQAHAANLQSALAEALGAAKRMLDLDCPSVEEHDSAWANLAEVHSRLTNGEGGGA